MPAHRRLTFGWILISWLIVAVLGLTAVQPIIAAPVGQAEQGESGAGLADLDTLAGAEMSAADIQYYFDDDGIILVNDLEAAFTLANTSGEATLLTRLFSKGETGTNGAGAYAYLYRLDLSQLVSDSPSGACVSQVRLPFGPVSPLDYDGDSGLEDYFVVSVGGALGSAAPSMVVQDSSTWEISIRFDDPVCGGNGGTAGESTFYIGFASYETYRGDMAQLIISPTGGQVVTVGARVPLLKGENDCSAISSPAEIPSPATIHFDSLADETAILNAYQASYGVSFNWGVKAETQTVPFGAKSEPNVAYAPFVAGVVTNITVSFEQPVSHVGFYAGNGSAAGVGVLVSGYQVQAGQPDELVCQYRTTLPAAQMETYMGFYDPQGRIRKVTIEYPGASTGEMIDDLQFAPGSDERTEFPRARTPLSGGGPRIVINRSDNLRFAATFHMPDAALWMEEQADGDMRRLRFAMPGAEINANLAGYPDVPLMRRLIAIPEGSTPELLNYAVVASDMLLADLYPAQPSAMDGDTDPPPGDPNDWVNPPYTLDGAAYATNAFFPAQPVSVYPLGKMRDLNLALVVVAGGQYNPVTRELRIFEQVDLEVAFQGGLGTFLPDYSNNPFEPGIQKQYGSVLNAGDLAKYLGAWVTQEHLGSELIIFTHPTFLPAANTLAEWKREKGISTLVVQTGGANLDTPQEIKAFIKDKYENSVVRPSYVLLIGDAEYIGSFVYPYNPPNLKYSSSDLDYVLMSEGDTFPDLGIGRIPVDDINQANRVVNKIIAYEKNPPIQSSFYNNVALASYFECCSGSAFGLAYDDRSFVESSEAARAALVADGKTATRIYTTNTSDSLTPAFYRNGAILPAEIGTSSGFPWDGETNDVISAFNSGTGLIMHRDHGSPSGWGDPHFSIDDLPSLSNGNLTPVVYSINCSSGLWDNELPAETKLADTDVSWIERILRMNGGAVSIIGDLRNSPTWANSALARGLVDATWPATDPDLGGSTPLYRLGDILNSAKLYMFIQIFVPQTAGSVTYDQYALNNHIYHVVGDPTLELWKEAPRRRMVRNAVYHWGGYSGLGGIGLQEYPTLTVEYPIEGAQITLLQNGGPIGRGTVSGGLAEITFVANFDPSLPLQVSACTEDDICTSLEDPYQLVYLPAIIK